MTDDPIARAAQSGLSRRTRPAETSSGGTAEKNVLVRLAAPLHRRFRNAAQDADLHQSDLFRALVMLYLDDPELANRAEEQARKLGS